MNPQLYAYNSNVSITIPAYPAVPAELTLLNMMFALVGAGGGASSNGSGGGGSVYIGSVQLRTNLINSGTYFGTTVYLNIGAGGTGSGQATFLSLQPIGQTTPALGEPAAYNGGTATTTAGTGGLANGGLGYLTDDGDNHLTVTTIYSSNGFGGVSSGTIGTVGGAPKWQPYPQWSYITYPNNPNNPNGQIQSSGNGGSITQENGTPAYGTGEKGMIVLQFNYPGFNYSLYPSIPMLNYDFPFFYTVNSSIVVPYLPGNTDGTVPVTFVLQGSGGNGDAINTMICTTTIDNTIYPVITYFSGGGGGAIKGIVSLPPGTTIYVHISTNGNGTNDGTFISLTPPTGNLPPPGTNQMYASPYSAGGTNPYGLVYDVTGNPGNGGTNAALSYLENTITNASYNVTIPNSQAGNAGYSTCVAPIGGVDDPVLGVWVPPDNYVAYPYNQLYTVPVPDNAGQAGVGVANNTSSYGYGTNGIALLGFGIDIPWKVDSISEYRRRQALKRIPCFVPGTRILTPLGYTPVQNLVNGGLVTTDRGKHVPVKIHTRTLVSTDRENAPYLIPKNCLGPFMPAADLRLSPLHAFRLQPDLWHIPKYAANENKQIIQYDIGKPITYYHLECPNYFTDNLMADGCIVESYGRNQVEEESTLYAYDQRRKGFVRTAKQKNVVMYRR